MYAQLFLDQSDSKILETAVTQEKCELLSYFFAYGYAPRGIKNQCVFFKVMPRRHAQRPLK